MKFSRLALAASSAVLALFAATQAGAEEYDGVLRHRSTQARSEVQAQAVSAAHAPNPYAEGAASVVAATPSAPRDRAAVVAEARARAHAPNQNLWVEAFVNSRVPDAYGFDKQASTRQTRAADGTAVR